ncbi:hypothetical protein [Providencia vermicola]|uniref:hypothetical protein n=1 Tax=Providencia vermicola TaxID=333965 RepID=UPI00220C7702|nr:RNA-binding protein [Providencia stuartii]
MANNELGQKGFVSIENFWGDKIKSIIVMHSADNIEKTEGAVNNISHGEKEENVFQFYYQTHLFPFKNMWKVIVITTDDEVYETDGYFSCSITASDKGVAVVGVNGDTKTAYVSFSESGSCSEKLRRVNRHSMFDSQSERYLR